MESIIFFIVWIFFTKVAKNLIARQPSDQKGCLV
jgi:hypothetical protein